MRSIGRRARPMISSLSSMRGASFSMQSWSFSRVFIFMNLHSLQRQLSVGAGMKVLSGHSFFNRCNIPASVAMMIWRAGLCLQ